LNIDNVGADAMTSRRSFHHWFCWFFKSTI